MWWFVPMVLAGCAKSVPLKALAPSVAEGVPIVSAQQEDEIRQVMAKHNVVGVGVGIIRDGKLTWTGYYGEQAPGLPASAETMFNTASVNKAVATETFIRLAEEGSSR